MQSKGWLSILAGFMEPQDLLSRSSLCLWYKKPKINPESIFYYSMPEEYDILCMLLTIQCRNLDMTCSLVLQLPLLPRNELK